ncbi:hypothetical protein DTO212C5_7512 [Paecilomyces variotii]|nr:hypothetical protein DTO212C5_7512 [Paecilomyces variotii]
MLSSGLWRVSTPTAAAGLNNNGPSVLLWIERLHLQSCPCLSTPAFLPYLIIGISMLYVLRTCQSLHFTTCLAKY